MNLPDAPTLAALYALPSLPQVEPLEANVFMVRAGGAEYALKVYPSSEGLDAQRYEHWVLLALQGLSFALPIPLRTQEGATFHIQPDQSVWSLSRRLYGEYMRPNDPDHAYAVGAALAELHRALAGMAALPRPDFPDYNLENRTLLHLRGSLPTEPLEIGLQPTPEGVHRLKRFLRLAEQFKNPPPMPNEELHWHIIHGDFFGSNILYNGDVVSGVLDFKFARPDYRVREFAETLLRVTNDLGPLFWGTARSFVEGYASMLKLTRPEIKLVPRFMVEYHADRVLFYANHEPSKAANALRVQEDISAWLEVEQSRLDAMLRGVFLGE